MLTISLLTIALAGFASAVPLQGAPLAKRAFNSSLPTVQIFATGGTIAGAAGSGGDVTEYAAGSLGIDVLLNAVPLIGNFSNVVGTQFSNVASESITDDLRLQLSRNVTMALGNSTISGVVVTHGTDTLEETAFFLEITVKSAKPVVIVGAMRPATAISPDGPFNLLEAVSVASSPEAMNRGAMIVLNDRIGSAFYITKTHADRLDTFKNYETGNLGEFVATVPRFYYEPAQPSYKPYFDVSSYSTLPKVYILYAYQSMPLDTIWAAVAKGAKGIVIAGEGAGGTSPEYDYAITEILAMGIPVVRSFRTMNGYISPDNEGISSGVYNPIKSRVLLQLALAKYGADFASIRTAFATGYSLPPYDSN